MDFAFLSHRSVDKPRIRDFVLQLMAEGLRAWVDDPLALDLGGDFDDHIGRIGAGGDWPAEIDRALGKAAVIIVFLSREWAERSAFLGQEYAIALHRHRTGEARYLPVFLDEPSTFPEELQHLRSELHDDVQGINVARHGDSGWSHLLGEVRMALAEPARGTDAVVRSGQAVDWVRILRDRPRSPEALQPLLLALPQGPPVDAFAISAATRNRIVDSTESALSASAAVGEANALIMDTFRIGDDDKYAFLIMRGTVPHPDKVPLQDYWYAVLDRACFLGPRMLAAVLLASPPGALSGSEERLGSVLARFEGGPS